jgi:serine/threonine-protein kinase RsbW
MSLKQNIFKVHKADDSIRFTFSSTMINIDDVVEQTSLYLQQKSNSIATDLFSVNLVLREALTNAVRHGNQGDSRQNVRFVLTIVNNEYMELVIEDEGEGFDWKELKTQSLGEDEDHGRGLIIMKTYFNKVSYNDRGNILYLGKKIGL